MLLGIISIVVVVVVGTLIELYVYDRGLFWHEDDRDPRNFPPPR